MRSALLGLLCLSAVTPAAAQPTEPERCRIGVYVVGLNEFNVQRKAFEANFWLWSLCATEQRQPLKSMEFVNAITSTATLDAVLPREGQFWSSRKVSGTFRHDWDVRNFPFDRHVIAVVMEEGIDDVRALQYEADQAKSGVDRQIELPGWRVNGFRLVQTERRYDTTFGDPSLPVDASAEYAQLKAEITLSRDGYTSFLKLASVVYVAATLALLSFLFLLDSPSAFGSRISFLAGSLFATVINMRVASTELGSDDGLTLIDLIHIVTLVLILTVTVLTIAADRRLHAADRDVVRGYDLRNLIACALVYVAANVALIANAAIQG
ncbi:MAG: hypothetical protein Q8M26_09980 [Pseudolabrys sp.]|nr:hypothetical protein [Pseudolabrys sp.]